MAKNTKKDIPADVRDAIVAQSISEISHDRIYKQGKVPNWQKNEAMYYNVKQVSDQTRANVSLGQMQEHVHTIQSKVQNQKIFKFLKRKESQLKRVQRLNALRDVDRGNDHWDMKFLLGAKQLIIYGREVYNYYADSTDGYMPHLKNVDAYDFLIDPEGGGFDIEEADHLGDYGVSKTRKELEEGRDSGYIADAVEMLLAGVGNNTEQSQEERNKYNRSVGQNTTGLKALQKNDKFKFWRWFTTFEDERYYLLMQERAGTAVRIERLTDIFTPNKYFKKGAWPYWTNAAFPDLTEFWTPSYCDYIREILMAQEVSIDQMLDNSEAINKPMKVVNTGAIEDLGKLKYRRDGIIPTKGAYDANKAVQVLAPVPLEGPIMVFDKLEGIKEKASGVNAGSKGAEQNDSGAKATIYFGNQQEARTRFDLLDFSRSYGIERFSRLYEIGVRDHLTKKVAVDMLGPEGIETEEVSRRDIFRKSDDFRTMVEDSKAEATENVQKQAVQINFINNELANPAMKGAINPKKAFEFKAKIAGLSEDTIKELQDTSEFGNQELLAEAARDIESLLEGERIKPNLNANNAYKRKFVDFMIDHQEDMTEQQFQAMTEYLRGLADIIARNEARAVNQFAITQMLNPGAPTDGAGVPPIKPVEEPLQNGIQIPSR